MSDKDDRKAVDRADAGIVAPADNGDRKASGRVDRKVVKHADALEQETLRAIFGTWRHLERKIGRPAGTVMAFLGDETSILELLLPPGMFLRILSAPRLQEGTRLSKRIAFHVTRMKFPLCTSQLNRKAWFDTKYLFTFVGHAIAGNNMQAEFNALEDQRLAELVVNWEPSRIDSFIIWVLKLSTRNNQFTLLSMIIRSKAMRYLRRDYWSDLIEMAHLAFGKIPVLAAYTMLAKLYDSSVKWKEFAIPYHKITSQLADFEYPELVTLLSEAGVPAPMINGEVMAIGCARGDLKMVTEAKKATSLRKFPRRCVLAALSCGHHDLIERLPDLKSVYERCPSYALVRAAVESDSGQVLNYIGSQRNPYISVAIRRAISTGCVQSLEWLLKSGAPKSDAIRFAAELDRVDILELICGKEPKPHECNDAITTSLDNHTPDVARWILDRVQEPICLSKYAIISIAEDAQTRRVSPIVEIVSDVCEVVQSNRRTTTHPMFDLRTPIRHMSLADLELVAPVLGYSVAELAEIRGKVTAISDDEFDSMIAEL